MLDQNLCSPHAGTVDICLCLALPLRSRRRVIDKVQDLEAAGWHQPDGTLWECTLLHSQGKPGVLWHVCMITYPPIIDPPYIEVAVYTELFLKDMSLGQIDRHLSTGLMSKGISLNVMNEYVIRTFTKDFPSDFPPLFICPHVDIIPAVRKFFENRRKSEFSRHKDTSVCVSCAVILRFDWDSELFRVKVTRNLGKDDAGPWPDEAWSVQSKPRLWPDVTRWIYCYCLMWLFWLAWVFLT